jgi:bacterioferritin
MSPKTAARQTNSDQKEKTSLINHLNEDLAGELSAIIQYITYAAKVTGPYRPELVAFFLAEVPDEQGHAQFLSNKIVALGGEPTTEPRPVTEAITNQELVEAVLAAEQRAVRDYTKRAEEAEEYGDKGLTVELENIITDETKHAEETERILRDWSA